MSYDIPSAVYDAAQFDFEPFPYSGRDMYGKECIAVSVDDMDDALQVALRILDSVPSNIEPDVRKSSEFPVMRVDNVGLGYVVYWPALEWNQNYMENSQ